MLSTFSALSIRDPRTESELLLGAFNDAESRNNCGVGGVGKALNGPEVPNPGELIDFGGGAMRRDKGDYRYQDARLSSRIKLQRKII